jgi:type I restriction enzyme S subunit
MGKTASMWLADTQRKISPEGLASCGTTMVPAPSIILSTRAPIGSVALAALPMCTNQGCRALVPIGRAAPEFFAYLLSVAGDQLSLRGRGTTFLELSGDELGAFRVPLPPPTEQKAVAIFLDRETAKIDALIAEQEQLIALLKEKRQAAISHAVTKGLNPDVLTKPSGIEWLGDVPAHWEVVRLKRELLFVTSGSRGWAENYSDEGDLFLRIANLTRDGIGLGLSDVQRVAVPAGAETERTRVKAGDILFSITAYLGSVAVVPDWLSAAYVSQHVALARLHRGRLKSRWVGYVALSTVGRTWFEAQSYGGTKVQLSLDDIRDLPVPLPPLAEQIAILANLEAEVAQLNQLSLEAGEAVALLRERRTALISAAVTGQIDVRGLHRNSAD